MNRYLPIIICGVLLSACEGPKVATAGTPITEGGVTFIVNDYDVEMLELHEGNETFEYPLPVLKVPISMKNEGPDAFTYAPSHNTQQMSEATTPILYPDPGPDVALPPESKTVINGVFLEKGTPTGQLTASTAIQAGETINDIFLFEVPPKTTSSLVFSIPPSMHRGKYPVLVRIPYIAKELKGPKVIPMGTPVSFDSVSLIVTSAKLEYVKIKDSAQGEGFSSEPLLRVDYVIENTSDQEILYNPAHQALSGPGAMLFGKSPYSRVQFPATTTIPGQVAGQVKLEPGKSTKDVILFDVNDDGSEATLEYPASLFARTGLARVRIEFDATKPPLPKELEPPKPAAQKSDG